jgi:hypothetical protein
MKRGRVVTVFAPETVAASVSRALWGEVSRKLRSVQFRAADHQIDLRFYFDGDPDDSDLDSIGSVGAEVAADFPETAVSEEAIAAAAHGDIVCQDGWHTAYARKEASLTK